MPFALRWQQQNEQNEPISCRLLLSEIIFGEFLWNCRTVLIPPSYAHSVHPSFRGLLGLNEPGERDIFMAA